jgi:MGT family glycosyltransferase
MVLVLIRRLVPAGIGDSGVDALPDGIDDESFVLVSLGSGYQDQLSVLQRIVDAAAGIDRRFVVTTGPAISPSSLRLPRNVTAVGFVPHQRLMSRAALVITHAGLGTVMAALHDGVPLLCMPLGRDQFGNAEWVKAKHAGRALAADADVETIGAAIKELLAPNVPERADAQLMARAFEGCGGANAATEALEHVASARLVS